MPCTDRPSTFEDGQRYHEEAPNRERMRLQRSKEEVTRLTNMLCAVCGKLEKLKPEILLSELIDIGNWYYQHKRWDEEKTKEEQERKEQQLLYKKRQIEDLQKEIEELSKD